MGDIKAARTITADRLSGFSPDELSGRRRQSAAAPLRADGELLWASSFAEIPVPEAFHCTENIQIK